MSKSHYAMIVKSLNATHCLMGADCAPQIHYPPLFVGWTLAQRSFSSSTLMRVASSQDNVLVANFGGDPVLDSLGLSKGQAMSQADYRGQEQALAEHVRELSEKIQQKGLDHAPWSGPTFTPV